MIYAVKARYIEDRLDELAGKLADGSIAAQRPDGREIVESMHRARITAPGIVEWTEQCFCHLPLHHERQTVYDHYFTDLQTRPIEAHQTFEGKPFMTLLNQKMNAKSNAK